MRKIILIVSICLIAKILGCNQGDELDIVGLGNSLYGDIKITLPRVTLDLEYMTFNTDDSTTTVFFTAFAKRTVLVNEVRAFIQPYPLIEGNIPDTTRIVNITNDNCLIDIENKPDSLSLKMIRNSSYDFCYKTSPLKADTNYQITFVFYGYEIALGTSNSMIGSGFWWVTPF